jgi:hypothetical protein
VARPRSSSQLAWRLGVSDSYVRHVTWQLRTRHGQPPLAERRRARRPTTRAWAIIRRAQRAHQRTSDRQHRGERRQVDRTSRTDRTGRSAPGSASGRTRSSGPARWVTRDLPANVVAVGNPARAIRRL